MSEKGREACLDRAKELISKERAAQYGDFKDNYTRTAELATIMTGKELTLEDIMLILICIKFGRESTNHKPDNVDDAIGYLALYLEMKEDEA